MQLKTLEIVGFKSFADRVRLEFPPGITAVVGPNGCGKSNVLDAMRWVLGEQRPRALRGARMEDVIFSGTEGRKSLGMAEVNVTLTDLDPAIGLEFEEVTVTRRLFRSGESVYLLNKTPCRLRDIRSLFMDTGIGRTAYSVMEQGRIDQILSSRPEDRREIFEEAAGVTRFKQQKHEALRKLDHTAQNLERLAAIIREVKRQIGSLRRQAGKARRYKELHDRLRILDLRLAWEHHLVFRTRHEEATRIARDSAAACLRLRAQIDASEAEIHEFRASAEEAEAAAADARRNRAAAQSDADRTRQSLQFCRERLEAIEQDSRRNEGDIDSTGGHLAAQEKELAGLDAQRDDRVRSTESAQTALSEAETALAEVNAAAAAARDQLEAARKTRLSVADEAMRARNDANRLDASLAEATVKKERLKVERARADEERERLRKRLEEFRAGLETARATAAESQAAVDEMERKEQDARGREQGRLAAAQDREREIAGLESRIDALEELSAEESLDGGTSAEWLTESPEGLSEPLREAILGRLVDHIEVESGLIAAVEAVLGDAVRALAISDPDAAPDLADAAWETANGYAMLATRRRDRPAPADLPEGYRHLADAIGGADPHAAIARGLVADWVVAPSIAEAHRLVAAREDVRCVTPRGETAAPAGLYRVGRQSKEPPGVLGLRHQIGDLQVRAEELRRTTAEVRAAATSAAAEAESAAACLRELRAGLRHDEVALATREGELSAMEADDLQQRKRVETIEWELEAIEIREKEVADERAALEERLAGAEQRDRACAEAIAAAERDIERIADDVRKRESTHNERNIASVLAQQELRALDGRREPLAGHVAELRRILDQRKRDIEESRLEHERLVQRIADDGRRIEEVEGGFEALDEAIRGADEERTAIARSITTAEERLRGDREDLAEQQDLKSEADVRVADTIARMSSLEERIARDYQVRLDDPATVDPVLENARELLPEEPDWTVVEGEVDELRERLSAMGAVNLVAIEEFDELEQRYADLCAQQEDMLKASQDLHNLIQKINATSREKFAETFELIRVNFQKTFRELFGGGHANLLLIDEEDLLESGIEIVARPPGKKLQNVSLLSGGERTLTAVALLFAIYMVKPSPFCILDELDAALDESNINRYVEMLRRFAEKSQFVVITHSKRTIAAADVLYGITMQQTGVSKVVSARLTAYDEAPSAQVGAPTRDAASHDTASPDTASPGAASPGADVESPGIDPRDAGRTAEPVENGSSQVEPPAESGRDVDADVVQPEPAPAEKT